MASHSLTPVKKHLKVWLSLGLVLGISVALIKAQQDPYGTGTQQRDPYQDNNLGQRYSRPSLNAGSLLQQGLEQINTFNNERVLSGRKQELAKFIPAGEEVTVTVSYKVFERTPGIRIIDEIYPS